MDNLSCILYHVSLKTFENVGDILFVYPSAAFREELALLQKLRHPNIVQFLGAVTQSTPMRIILEYCEGV